MTWQFDWITNWDEIWSESFVSRWHEWMKVSPTAHVFFHPTLVRVWVDTYMPLRRMEPRFLVATNQGSTVFLPMVLWRRNWRNSFQRLLIPVGYSDYDYHDPIIVGEWCDQRSKAFWNAFMKEACRKGTAYDALELNGLRWLEACFGMFAEEFDVCPWSDLSGFSSGEVFLGSLDKSLRGDIRRQERRMAEFGPIDFHVFESSEVNLARETLDELLSVHAKRWPQAYKAPGFHSNLVRLGIPASVVHFSRLSIGPDVAAWHLGFIYASRFYYYMPAHNEAFGKLSPGKILLFYCVRDAIERGLKVFDHLRGSENYKAGWTNHADRLYSLCITGNAFGASVRNLAAGRIKPALGRLLRHYDKARVHG